MTEPRPIEIQDPFEVDLAIAGARAAHDRWRRAIWLDPSRSAALDPWTRHRAIAGKTTFDR
ncbi:MAG TPA: hypothetical protein VF407_00260, partial [Polyangiaceae bacterium]